MGRNVEMAYVAFRIYRENAKKLDAKGTFDGLNDTFDEWIPLNSPRLMPFERKTGKKMI